MESTICNVLLRCGLKAKGDAGYLGEWNGWILFYRGLGRTSGTQQQGKQNARAMHGPSYGAPSYSKTGCTGTHLQGRCDSLCGPGRLEQCRRS